MSAYDRATTLQPGSTLRWDRLEREAFAVHPGVLDGRSKAVRRPRRWELLYLVPLTLLVMAFIGTPIWGYVAIAADGSRFATAAPDSDPNVTIAVAGVMYVCALITLLGLVVDWFVTRRPKSGIHHGYAMVAAVLAVMTMFSMYVRGRAANVESWSVWIIPVAATAVLGVMFAITLLVVKLRHGASDDLSPKEADLLDARRQRIAQLSDAERAAVQADLGAAIDELERRRLITGATAARARDVELGALGLRLRKGRTRRTAASTA